VGRRRVVSDAHVLHTARHIFSTQGFAASTREIAAAAGLSQAALFQRFGDKSALFLSALVPAPVSADLIIGDADVIATQHGTLAAAQEIAGRMLTAMRELLPLLTAISTSPDLDRAVLQAAHDRLQGDVLFGRVARTVSGWEARGDLPAHLTPSAVVEVLVVAVHGILLMSRSQHFRSTDVERASLDRVVAAAWGGRAPG
jgi:AcrR family transcriptional regulator